MVSYHEEALLSLNNLISNEISSSMCISKVTPPHQQKQSYGTVGDH